MTPRLSRLCRDAGYRQVFEARRDNPDAPPRPRPEPPLPLRQWLQERLGPVMVSEAKQKHYRTPDAALAILEAHCIGCEHYDARKEVCTAFRGCGALGSYRHVLTSVSGKCPRQKWPPTTIHSHSPDETPKENNLPPVATGSTSSNTPESRVNKPENSVQAPCIHRLSQPVGTLNCTCRSKPSVYQCQEPAIVSGFCMPDVPKTSSAGQVRLRTGELTTDRYVPHVLREGETPRPHEIVCCSSCPIREAP